MRILLLTAGLDVLGDDAAGLSSIGTLKKDFEGCVDIIEGLSPGAELSDLLEGYDAALILDFIITKRQAGVVLEFSSENAPHVLPDLVQCGRLPADRARRVAILAVEIPESGECGKSSGAAGAEALPFLVRRAKQILEGWLDLERCCLARSTAC